MPASSTTSQNHNRVQQVNAPRILVMAAGTGGHVFPALAVAEELVNHGAVIHWLGTPSGMENDLVKPSGYPMHAIHMQGLRGKGIGRLLKLPGTLLSATLAAVKIIRSNQIDLVIGFGGYVTAPGGLAARMTGTPLVIHEQNAIAGMSNRYLAKMASKVLQAFEHTFSDSSKSAKLETVGNPIRNAISGVAVPNQRYDLTSQQPLKLLIVGGSLGAQVLNETVPQTLALMQQPLQVRHQCGRNNEAATQTAYASVDTSRHQVEVSPFIEDMAAAYNWADIIVCRAGALTVTEIQNVGIAAIFVPLPHAVDDHQTANAKTLTDIDAAILLPQRELTAPRLAELLSSLDRSQCLAMAERGYAQAQRGASQRVADIVLQMLATA
nr:undecaprenyldiphospho-muramoylpentapeptide beta-N-acetylglucosaminyltransferase [Psychrobacter pygoscelis]